MVAKAVVMSARSVPAQTFPIGDHWGTRRHAQRCTGCSLTDVECTRARRSSCKNTGAIRFFPIVPGLVSGQCDAAGDGKGGDLFLKLVDVLWLTAKVDLASWCGHVHVAGGESGGSFTGLFGVSRVAEMGEE